MSDAEYIDRRPNIRYLSIPTAQEALSWESFAESVLELLERLAYRPTETKDHVSAWTLAWHRSRHSRKPCLPHTHTVRSLIRIYSTCKMALLLP